MIMKTPPTEFVLGRRRLFIGLIQRASNRFSLRRALFQAQGEGIGEHGDELGVRRLALDV